MKISIKLIINIIRECKLARELASNVNEAQELSRTLWIGIVLKYCSDQPLSLGGIEPSLLIMLLTSNLTLIVILDKY